MDTDLLFEFGMHGLRHPMKHTFELIGIGSKCCMLGISECRANDMNNECIDVFDRDQARENLVSGLGQAQRKFAVSKMNFELQSGNNPKQQLQSELDAHFEKHCSIQWKTNNETEFKPCEGGERHNDTQILKWPHTVVFRCDGAGMDLRDFEKEFAFRDQKFFLRSAILHTGNHFKTAVLGPTCWMTFDGKRSENQRLFDFHCFEDVDSICNDCTVNSILFEVASSSSRMFPDDVEENWNDLFVANNHMPLTQELMPQENLEAWRGISWGVPGIATNTCSLDSFLAAIFVPHRSHANLKSMPELDNPTSLLTRAFGLMTRNQNQQAVMLFIQEAMELKLPTDGHELNLFQNVDNLIQQFCRNKNKHPLDKMLRFVAEFTTALVQEDKCKRFETNVEIDKSMGIRFPTKEKRPLEPNSGSQ